MRKKMAIVSSYFSGESYGLLGPQLAATIIRQNTGYDCIVVAVTNEDSKKALQSALTDYFGSQRPIVGFSLLSGREDLFSFARELTDQGTLTLLAGPQADSDFRGEVGWRENPHRFHGLAEHFCFAVSGPAEQVISPLRNGCRVEDWQKTAGVLHRGANNDILKNPVKKWEWRYFNTVEWDNLYVLTENGLRRHAVKTGQVLQQIGCPHASRQKEIVLDYPTALSHKENGRVTVNAKGCSFCDVAADKGFCGTLDDDTVVSQISCLPEDHDGRKIPFELINENPLPALPRLLRRLAAESIRISQINLIMRADWFLAGKEHLRESLEITSRMEGRIMMASMGFEAFDDNLLRNFNKGYSVGINVEAIRFMRQLKEAFPGTWLYSNKEGAVHGFIHPTPWDTRETEANTHKVFALYGLANDILPVHSTPLIIHHASVLGDWIRAVEVREGVLYRRYASIIGWWDEGVTHRKT